MSERNPFEQHPKGPERTSGRELRCEEWEALLADALDGVMPAADNASFESHSHTCAACASLLAQSRQGQEWMRFLHFEPEATPDLMERILARTSGAVAERPLAVYGAPIAAGPGVMPLPRRRFVWDTRLMMTAAMAFFSIALTLNLAGVQLTHLKLSDLTPASIESNLTRQFYGAKSEVVRYYDNLRFVYEVESKMRELRRDEDTQRPALQPQGGQPEQKTPAPQNTPTSSNGHKTGGKVESSPAVAQPNVIFGPKALARAGSPDTNSSGSLTAAATQARHQGFDRAGNKEQEEVYTLFASLEDQAERGLV